MREIGLKFSRKTKRKIKMNYEVLVPMLTPSLLKKPANTFSKEAVGTGMKPDPTEKIRNDVKIDCDKEAVECNYFEVPIIGRSSHILFGLFNRVYLIKTI